MQNLYQVDTTGKAYTLDVAPLMALDDKRAAINIAGIQARAKNVSDLVEVGTKAANDYQARKQLANLSAQSASLQPGSPTYEQDVAKLVYSNPLAFNNPNTAKAATLGMSSMASAHAQALKQSNMASEQNYALERQRAGADERLNYMKESYKLRAENKAKEQGAPLDVGAVLRDIEGGGTGVAPPAQATPDQTAQPVSDGNQGDPGQPGTAVNPPASDGPGFGADGAAGLPDPNEPVTPDASLFPDQSGNEGPTGPAGKAGPVAITTDPKAPASAMKGTLTSEEAELKRKMTTVDALAASEARNDRSQNAAQLLAAKAVYQKKLDELKASPEYAKELLSKQVTLNAEMSKMEAESKKPEVADALASQFESSLPPAWTESMKKDIAGAKNATDLKVKQDAWFRDMSIAEQAQRAGLPVTQTHEEYKQLSTDQARYQSAKAELAAATKGVDIEKLQAMANAPAAKGSSAADKKLNIEREAAQKKLEKLAPVQQELSKKVDDAQKKLDETMIKSGLKEAPKEDPAQQASVQPQPEQSAYDKAINEGAPDKRFIKTDESVLNTAKDKLAMDYPEIVGKLKEIATKNPTMEQAAIVDALKPFVDKDNPQFFRKGIMDFFGGVDPKDLARQVIADIRARNNSVPSSGTTGSKKNFTVEVVK